MVDANIKRVEDVTKPMKWIPLYVLILLQACSIDKDKKVDRKKFSFKTGSDTQLFFKNVRQSYYDLEENKAAKFNVFRNKKRVKDAPYPILNFAIVINYLQDEAYLLLEPNEIVGDLPLVIEGTNDSTRATQLIRLDTQNPKSTLEFATDLYDLLQDNSFQLIVGNEKLPILNNAQSREAFRVTISDYYRLTRVF